jgi:hypothetical protein
MKTRRKCAILFVATCFATVVATSKRISANGNKTPEPSPETPFTTFVQLDVKSSTPSQFGTPGAFTIIRLQPPAGLSERITKLSPVPALLLSVSLKPLPRAGYQLWTADKLLPTSDVRAFRSNVIDFESELGVTSLQRDAIRHSRHVR